MSGSCHIERPVCGTGSILVEQLCNGTGAVVVVQNGTGACAIDPSTTGSCVVQQPCATDQYVRVPDARAIFAKYGVRI